MLYDVIETHIDNINQGDTVIHNGEISTVSGNNIKYCNFIGKSIFGDNYHSGYKLVKKLFIYYINELGEKIYR